MNRAYRSTVLTLLNMLCMLAAAVVLNSCETLNIIDPLSQGRTVWGIVVDSSSGRVVPVADAMVTVSFSDLPGTIYHGVTNIEGRYTIENVLVYPESRPVIITVHKDGYQDHSHSASCNCTALDMGQLRLVRNSCTIGVSGDIDFGIVQVDSMREQLVTLTNTTALPIDISKYLIRGSRNFHITDNPKLAQPLAPHDTIQLHVRYMPTGDGAESAIATFFTCSDDSSTKVNFSAGGETPKCSTWVDIPYAPNTLNGTSVIQFGKVDAKDSLRVFIQNKSVKAMLTVHNIAVSPTPPFSIDPSKTSMTLAPGVKEFITVYFTPGGNTYGYSDVAAHLTYTTNGSGCGGTQLAARVERPLCAVSPQALTVDFGEIYLGTLDSARFVVRNTSRRASLTVTWDSVFADPDLTVRPAHGLSTIKSGDSLVIVLFFKPSSATARNVVFTVHTDEGGCSRVFTILARPFDLPPLKSAIMDKWSCVQPTNKDWIFQGYRFDPAQEAHIMKVGDSLQLGNWDLLSCDGTPIGALFANAGVKADNQKADFRLVGVSGTAGYTAAIAARKGVQRIGNFPTVYFTIDNFKGLVTTGSSQYLSGLRKYDVLAIKTLDDKYALVRITNVDIRMPEEYQTITFDFFYPVIPSVLFKRVPDKFEFMKRGE